MAAADAAGLDTSDADAAGDPRPLQSCFDAAMADVGPWEAAPVLAVAVSGGPDSLTACLLADAWARARGGHVLALIVDHQLRAESAAEARQLGAWLDARDIAHRLLVWQSAKPDTGIQDAARQARYALLDAACREEGILHLLTGHHLDDQVETVRMRAARRPDGPGVSGMPAVAERTHCRLLRPLLGMGKDALRDHLVALGQPWIEDPSNQAPAYERSALRAAPLEPAEEDRLLDHAAAAGNDRALAEAAAARILAAHARLHPAGILDLQVDALTCPPAVRNAVIAAAVTTVGGGAWPPGPDRVGALGDDSLKADFAGTTLGGCRIDRHGESLVFSREAGRAAPSVAAPLNRPFRWDDRFDVTVEAPARETDPSTLTVGALGEAGWAGIDRNTREATKADIPPAARASLPALFRDGELMVAPHLPFTKGFPPDWRFDIRFRPGRLLTTAVFRPFAMLAVREAGIV